LRGEQVTAEGRYVRLDRVALDWPPASPPPVYAGAIGPRSLRLSGEVADGTILTSGHSPERVRERGLLIDEGRVEGGRTDAHELVVFVHTATGADAAERLDAERERWGYDSMEDIAIAGDAATVATAVQRWVEAGADAVVLQPTPDEPDPEGFVRFVAGEVQSLLPN
jgi:alkanesulfonate monooxygenase SsuD/methylene tetrahydromethanopterin reductase-like flavin-dependent oxidoreductase (luciferase family)